MAPRAYRNHLKEKGYRNPVADREDFELRVIRAIHNITQQQLENVLLANIRRTALFRDHNR